jgi:ABC-2 type transport system permease protein
MNWNVLRAIFKRDFVSYFSNPTGYVFICVFVILSALATFWPPEFFANNLANLDQLSRWLPFIMLVFIPAITMSMWAEERRQGTDELLLTIPATDFDVVLGKYLAGVAIFTVSLLFSAFSVFLVFKYGLGDPDFGLFVSTYIGYWFIGIAMIAIGMVASFVTDNLTVGFILGTLFNMPLALAGVADWFVKDTGLAQQIRRWSALEQFQSFERGVLSLGGMVYFVMIAVVMLYLSMVLIGRRHWQARDEGGSLLGHYVVRAVSLLAVAVGLSALIQNHNWLRADISSEQLSSLSPDTIRLIRELKDDDDVHPIVIDAYVSPQVPTDYAPVKINLLSALDELKALGGDKIRVVNHEIQNYGEEAELAEKNFNIRPTEQVVSEAGSQTVEEFFMGIAFTSGLDKVVVPFLNKGIPVEYELVRSILTVSRPKRLRLGVVETGIPLMDAASADGSRDWPLITELRKQYEVSSVDPSQPIADTYDVLLVAQPSMLGPQELDHLVDAVKAGTPTALFEDPFPYFFPPQIAAGTGEPKMSQMGGMAGMFGGPQTEPKGDIEQLWRLLGVTMNPTQVVWQDYLPEESVSVMADPQWVFIDRGNGAQHPFDDENPISSGLNQLLLLYPGSFLQEPESKLKFDQLAVTGADNSGTVATQALARAERERANREVFTRQRTKDVYTVAAQVKGVPPADELVLEEKISDENDPADKLDENPAAEKPQQPEINVVLVGDIDWMIPSFFVIRERGEENFLEATQNVTFMLNIIDALAGDERFLEIRKRARRHRTLTRIDEATGGAREKAAEDQKKFLTEIQTSIDEANSAFEAKIRAVEERKGLSRLERETLISQVRRVEQNKLQDQLTSLEAQRRRKLKEIEYELEQDVRTVQDRYKLRAILLPPILPLLLALLVFFRRREAERQGVARERMR